MASPVIEAFVVNWGRRGLPANLGERVEAAVAAAVQVPSSGDGREDVRRWMCGSWLVRVFAPAWMTGAGFGSDATTLQALPELTAFNIDRHRSIVVEACAPVTKAHGAPSLASGAGMAAFAAADSSGGYAAREAAGPNLDLAVTSAWHAAHSALGDQARFWASDKAFCEGNFAAQADAASEALAPTVAELVDSAIALLGSMVRAGGESLVM